ncbi:inactive pancreatic lipase-related protein 1-like [Babylonia areolata]|uniref:inactive pancreatic lipase-related protein 1-like n=1 Tax=Babylonia areolata TaxID=304850 RepID=UPI003FD1A702
MAGLHLLFLAFTGIVPVATGFLLDGLHIGGSGSGGTAQNEEKCYPDLGCFSNRAPFHSAHRPLSLLPQDLADIGTTFSLFTRETWNTSGQEILDASNSSGVADTHFSAARATKVIVHGFTHSARRQWVQTMVRHLLKHDDLNVITVDWEKGAGLPYGQAAANARVVGAQLSQLLHVLAEAPLNHSQALVHLVGHSLGAHVAGYAGERTLGLGRITGLDPSDPYFHGTPPQVRLDPSDAQFVDVIHTDASTPGSLGMGMAEAMGHVDFYPNGGSHQPGCDQDLLSTLTHSAWSAVTVGLYSAEGAVACSHLRAIDLFTESIGTPCPFTAYPCSSEDDFDQGRCLGCPGNGCSRLGYHADGESGRGSMYLHTQDSASFCNYHYQINMTSENAVDGIITLTIYGDKGRTSPTPLTTKNEIVNTGATISHLVTSRTDVGAVTGVGVHFAKSHTILVHLLYSDTWTLRDVTMRSGETQTQSVFCAGGQNVPDQTMSVFHLMGQC